MASEKIIQQGAEAIIILKDDKIVKRRTKKQYRHPQLDEKIRKLRTRREAKTLEKATKIIFTPRIIKTDEKNKEITMEFIPGKKLSDNLNKFSKSQQLETMRTAGHQISLLHENDIIHGDLTTSNMILVEKKLLSLARSQMDKEKNKILPVSGSPSTLNKISAEKSGKADFEANQSVNEVNVNSQKQKLFFIDFGLSLISKKIEDKAVDIHLLIQALEAKHYENFTHLRRALLQGYNKHKDETSFHNTRAVLEQLKKVETRGRYKEKY